MPNLINEDGLTVVTQSEILTALIEGFQAAYGTQINTNPNSPDGQMINIFVQQILDQSLFLAAVNAGFDPDQATGIILDQRCQINGIQRQGGSYTVTDITVTTSGSVSLYGLDQTDQPVFTVQDNAGVQWQLQSSEDVSAGANVLAFQCAQIGAVSTVPNTITTPVTIILGVTAVNNPTTYITLGLNQETDAQLRLRRQKSLSLSSQGYLSSLLSALNSIPEVTSAYVYENNTSSTDDNDVPGHSIWVIVAGSGSSDLIAEAIYSKRNAGCGMKGTQSEVITQVDGSPFPVYWDVVTSVPLYTRVMANSLDGENIPNITAIKSGLTDANNAGYFFPGVAEQVNVNELGTLVQKIDSNTMISVASGYGFSLAADGTFTSFLTPDAKNEQFSVAANDLVFLPIIVNAPLATPTFDSNGLVTTMNVSVAHGGSTVQFTPIGGGYTKAVSNPWVVTSGPGSISTAGLFTSAAAGTSEITYTDILGNTATATVTST